MNKYVSILFGLLLMAAALPANARDVNESIDASAKGHVDVSNISGSIEVTGWSRNRVEVTGELGNKVEELVLERDDDKVLVKVKVPRRNSNNISSDIVVRVPEGSSINVSAVSADITVEGVEGEQKLHAVSGDIIAEVENAVSAHAVSGDIEISGNGGEFETSIHTVSGDVMLVDIAGSLAAEAVSGEMQIHGGPFDHTSLNTVNGDIEFTAALARGGKLWIETVNGDVDVEFEGDVSAKFDIETFNGDIDNCFGPEPRRTSRYTPGLELSFTEGGGNGRVDIQTLNGDIDFCR